MDAPYVPRLRGKLSIARLPDRRCSAAEAYRTFRARDDWAWRYHQTPQTRAFLGEPVYAGGAVNVDGADEGLRWPSLAAQITDYPLSMALWLNADVVTGNPRVLGLYDSALNDNRTCLLILGASTVASAESGTADRSGGAVTLQTTTWYHMAGRWPASNSRLSYLDGVDEASDGGTVALPTHNRVSFGGIDGATFITDFNGRGAEVVVYSGDIGADGALALGRDEEHPLTLSNVVAYAPCRDRLWEDNVRRVNATEVGTPDIADHPFPDHLIYSQTQQSGAAT